MTKGLFTLAWVILLISVFYILLLYAMKCHQATASSVELTGIVFAIPSRQRQMLWKHSQVG